MHHIQAIDIRLIFLIGKDKDYIKAQVESEKYQDMLVGDFRESFHNLTYKSLFQQKNMILLLFSNKIFKKFRKINKKIPR